MKKFLFYLAIVGVLMAAIYLFLGSEDGGFQTYVENRDLKTLEMRFRPEEIVELRREELLGNRSRTLLEPVIVHYPYLLMEVKSFASDQQSEQAAILWGLLDGEMVLDTDTWAKTKGFEEVLNSNVTPQEFRLLLELANNRGISTKERLAKGLAVEGASLNSLIEGLNKKKLLILRGSEILLHMVDPHFNVKPATQFNTQFVFKPSHEGKRVAAKYSRSKIEKLAKVAFGDNFTIRQTEVVFLPVVRIGVQNSDHSVLLSDWNGLTAERIF